MLLCGAGRRPAKSHGRPAACPTKDRRFQGRPLALVRHRRGEGARLQLDSFKWLKEESLEDADDLPEPEELATDAIAELEGAVEELNAVLALLENGEKK